MARYPIKDGKGIIDSGSTMILVEAFMGSEELKSIDIPNTVTRIGRDAFRGCENLTDIVIPDSVKKIGDRAFQRCEGLTNIEIPTRLLRLENTHLRDVPALHH